MVLHEAPDGDYINANTVAMEIPGSGIVNRYIATQGPLASTVGDFWHMLVEAGSTLVVMVTIFRFSSLTRVKRHDDSNFSTNCLHAKIKTLPLDFTIAWIIECLEILLNVYELRKIGRIKL